MICSSCGHDGDITFHLCIPKHVREEARRQMYEEYVGWNPAVPHPDPASLWRERAERAEAELQRLRVQLANREAQIHRVARVVENARLVSRNVNGTLSQDMLTKILSLVHPDRHGNSEVSNEVTRYILSLRK